MMTKLNFTLIFAFAIIFGIAQNNVRSNSLWQIENVANGAKGTFSLIVMDDESCTLSLITEDNTYQSKDCVVGKSTVIDYDGNLYQLDFNSSNNFSVNLTLKSKKETVEYRSSVNNKSNEVKITPVAPDPPKVAIVEPTKEKAPMEKVKEEVKQKEKTKEAKPATETSKEEVKELATSSKQKSKKKSSEEVQDIVSSTNRKLVYRPEMVNNCKKVYGILVFDITISKSGRVIASKINIGESKNPTSCLVSAAINVLSDMRWAAIEGNYEEDLTVTFNFVKP